MARYLNEIRLGKEKQRLRAIIDDVRTEFNLSTQKRTVPHITLFGPYDTDQGYVVKQHTQSVLSQYDVVPFTVSGFDTFDDTNVVYADIHPSKELKSLRRELANRLEPLTYNQRSWDLDDAYAFHLTIATNLGDRTAAVHDYLEQQYDLNMELHATRMTVLDRRRMMWEWDLPRGVELDAETATTKEAWEQTMEALAEAKGHSGRGGLLDRIRGWWIRE
jgi:2'-5' RNA ligase